MSSVFENAPIGLSNTITDYRGSVAQKVAEAKEKKEATGRTIEGSLGGIKVMLGGKGITKKILDDPVVKKFGAQLKTKITNGVKKAANDATESIKAKLNDAPAQISKAIRPGVQANPAAEDAGRAVPNPQPTETSFPSTPAGEAIEQQAVGASPGDIDEAMRAARAGSDTPIQGASPDEIDAISQAAKSGDTAFDVGKVTSKATDTVANDTVPAKALEQDVIPKGTSASTDVSTPSTAAGGSGASDVVAGGSDAAAAGAGAGSDAAVGLGETALAALDAIPFLDLFTLAAGAGLAGAAGRKHPPVKAALPPPSQAHVAFQSGLQNV